MTKERAIDLCKAIDQYLCAGNQIWDTKQIHDAMSMAIEALSAKDINVPSNGDLISRQDAIDALNGQISVTGDINAKAVQNYIRMVNQRLHDLPSAEPELKRGTWQRRKGSDCWECSQCHAVLENDDLRMHNFYFCYHCGANMMNKMGYMDIEEVHYE